ncbi:MAG TPA: lipase family protein, partial [Fluviicoccus sp.]|nr:lipase family protein [Fluviicoccus sp.]
MPSSFRFSPLLAAVLALPSAAALAAPAVGPGDASFYNPPAALTAGAHGELVWYRPAVVNLGAGAPAVQAWNVVYRSTDALGAANLVTGTVIVPATLWSGSGERPVVGYAVGTHGLAQGCAPSIQMAKGTDYESANIAAALSAGYAVLVSDNPGYTTGATPTYMSGISQGRALLDIFSAAAQIPGSGVSASAKAAIWGYSQGGQTAAWAGEMKNAYAPNLKLSAVAAGGIPADLLRTANYLDGSTGASFLLGAVIGLSTQYPTQIPLDSLTNATGKAAVAKGKSECVFEALYDFMNKKVSEYTVNNQTLAQLTAVPSINQTIKAQALGTGKIPVPLYQYHGVADEFIPIDQTVALRKAYCGKFANVTFGVYPSEHIVTQFQAAPT